MEVFATGATGARGRHLVPGLVAAGHDVTASTRTPGQHAQLRGVGSEGGAAVYYGVSQVSCDGYR